LKQSQERYKVATAPSSMRLSMLSGAQEEGRKQKVEEKIDVSK